MFPKIHQMKWVILFSVMLITIKAELIPDITLISDKIGRATYNMTCVVSGNSTNSAIIWNEPLLWYYKDLPHYVSKYIPARTNSYNCDINVGINETCNQFWAGREGWLRQSSIYSKLGPVTDQRWEEFKIYYTINNNPVTIAVLREANFKIHLSIRLKREAYIYLCDDGHPNLIDCLVIQLGGVGVSSNSIRICKNGRKYDKAFSKEDCELLTIGEIVHSNYDSLLSDVEWRHFTIEKESDNILLWKVGAKFPTLNNTNKQIGLLNIKYLSVKSETPGFWKIHQYTYAFANTAIQAVIGPLMEIRQNYFCIAMFVAMCDLCILKVEVIYAYQLKDEIIKTVIIKPIQGMEWQEEKIEISIFDTPKKIQLRIESICPSGNCDYPFWAIDKFQICSNNEIRTLSIKTRNKDQATCQFIKYSNWHISQTPLRPLISRENHCIGDTFSKSCIECSQILGTNKPHCDNSIICDARPNNGIVCSCATGYDGLACEKSLEKVEQIRVTYVDAASVSIIWKSPQGKASILYYNIRYKHSNYMACGNEHKMVNSLIKTIAVFGSTTVTLNNLLPYSEYLIEVSAFYFFHGIPTTIIAKTLQTKDLERSEMPSIKSMDISSTQVNITMQQVNCELIKGPIEYEATSLCSNSWCDQGVKNVIDFKNNSIILTELYAYSNYTVKIGVKRTNGNWFNGDRIPAVFRTNADVPSIIKNVTVYSKNATSLLLRFLPPYPPNGKLERYYITYCIVSRNVVPEQCKTYKFEPTDCKLWKEFHCVHLEKLEPNKKYELKIYAKNENTAYNPNATALYGITVQGPPDSVENLTYEWDNYHNLTLTWGHPNITNGQLTKFVVEINASEGKSCYNNSFSISEETYSVNYSYVIPFNICFATNLIIEIFAYNGYRGFPVIKTILSPPETPLFKTIMSAEAVTNSTITIRLPVPQELTINISVMYVIVSTSSINISKIFEKIDVSNNLDNTSWVAEKYDFVGVPETLQIGTGYQSNRMLNSLTTYQIYAVIINKFGEFKRFSVSTIEVSTTSHTGQVKGLSQSSYKGLWALLVLLILLIILAIIYRKRNDLKMYWIRTRNSDETPLTESKIAQFQLRLKPQAPAEEAIDVAQPRFSNVNRGLSKPVKIMDFEHYVKEAISNGELQQQHQLLPRGQIKSWDYGSLPENKCKNRYNNLIAYDSNRVVLNKINNDPYSDYINANYIEGYNSKKTYIATQGPKANTVNDFWRMIWQENVKNIIVLANVMEGGKKKTEQYWPNVNETLECGSIKIEYVSSRFYEDYERRRFLVSYKRSERRVEQLHFTSWPDHGVPLYPHSLVPFMRKILTIPHGNSPIVVHCSAGVGRTGTIILCDLCLRMAVRENVIDVLKHQYNIREQRINLVDNIEQYKLAHLVLLECLVAPLTNMSCDEETEGAIKRFIESEKLAEQLLYLNGTAWLDEAMRPMVTPPNPEWSSKNRFQDIIPWGYGHIQLSSDENGCYINAIWVDGFRAPQKFIVTQQPLPQTKADFWRMINEKAVTTIVSLNQINSEDMTSCIFWPTEVDCKIQPAPFITVQFQENADSDSYRIITLHMWNNEDKESTKRVIKLIIFKSWAADKTLPDAEESLLKLWEETKKISGNNNNIVVTCYDGAKACGLFTALSVVIEKIKFEQECDVCSAVRTVRHNRKQFITDIEQFSFLYRAAMKYLNCFDLYSNINPIQERLV